MRTTNNGTGNGNGQKESPDSGAVDHKLLLSTLLAVKKGDSVRVSQVIARVGTTGSSTGCHLHFETILNGAHTDPHADAIQVGQRKRHRRRF